MKRYFKRTFSLVLMLVTLVSLFSVQASAVSGRISFSDPSVTVGDTVTVAVSVTSDAGISGLDATLTYETSMLEFVSGSEGVEGGSGSIRLSYHTEEGPTQMSFSLKFKAKAVGTTVLHTTYGEITNPDEESFEPRLGTSTVTINHPGQASSDARLSSLKIGSGSLTPAFSPDVYDYSVTVPAGTEQLRVSVSTNNSHAKYSVSGTKLSVGENITTITVTAEDGTAQNYTIHVTRPEGEQKPEEHPENQVPSMDTRLPVTVDGASLYVAENLDGVVIPEGFELQTVQYGDREVPAAVGLVKPLTLFWLVDETGSAGAFYVQDTANGAFFPYVSLTSGQKMFTILPLADGVMPPEGYEESTITIDEAEYICWRNAAQPESEFVLMYAMNWDGDTGFYRYDTVERTMQRCTEDSMMDAQYDAESFAQLEREMQEKLDAGESARKQSEMLVLILSVVAAVELLLILVFFVRTKHRRAVHCEDRYEGRRAGSSRDEENEPDVGAEEENFES